jgi:hypothetical protein
MDLVITIVIGAVVLAAVLFLVFGNLRPARTAAIPERQKRDD